MGYILLVIGWGISLYLVLRHRNQRSVVEQRIDSLVTHPFFDEIGVLLNERLDLLVPLDTPENAVVREFVRMKLSVLDRNFRVLMESVAKGTLSVETYMSCMVTLAYEWEVEAEQLQIPLGRIERFSHTESSKVKQIRGMVDFILNTKIYVSDAERVNTILNVLFPLIYLILVDAQAAMVDVQTN